MTVFDADEYEHQGRHWSCDSERCDLETDGECPAALDLAEAQWQADYDRYRH